MLVSLRQGATQCGNAEIARICMEMVFWALPGVFWVGSERFWWYPKLHLAPSAILRYRWYIAILKVRYIFRSLHIGIYRRSEFVLHDFPRLKKYFSAFCGHGYSFRLVESSKISDFRQIIVDVSKNQQFFWTSGDQLQWNSLPCSPESKNFTRKLLTFVEKLSPQYICSKTFQNLDFSKNRQFFRSSGDQLQWKTFPCFPQSKHFTQSLFKFAEKLSPQYICSKTSQNLDFFEKSTIFSTWRGSTSMEAAIFFFGAEILHPKPF